MMYISFICFQMSLLLNSLTRQKILTGNCRKWMITVAFWVHGLLPLQYVAPHIKVTWWLCFYGNSRVEINISTDIFPVTTGSKWPYIFFIPLDLFFLFICSHGLMMLLLLLLIISFHFDFLISFPKSLRISWLKVFIILNCIVLLLLLYQFHFLFWP